MSRYVLTAEAQKDLQQIRDYLLKEAGFRVARHVLSSIATAFHSLVLTPGQGHRREDLTPREELRFWAVFSYLVVYRIDKRPLTVIAVVHGSEIWNNYSRADKRTGLATVGLMWDGYSKV